MYWTLVGDGSGLGPSGNTTFAERLHAHGIKAYQKAGCSVRVPAVDEYRIRSFSGEGLRSKAIQNFLTEERGEWQERFNAFFCRNSYNQLV